MTPANSPASLRRRPLALLSLGLRLLLTSASVALAVELPQVGTPWDTWAAHRAGDEFSDSLTLLDPGSGEGAPVYSCTGLPPELTLNKTTGNISGTIRSVGYFNIHARVTVGGLNSLIATRRIALMPAHVPNPGIHEVAFGHFDMLPLGGHVGINLQPAGTYSGSLRLGIRTIPLAGFLRPLADDPSSAEGPHVLARLPGPGGTRLIKIVVGSTASMLTLDFLDAATGESLGSNFHLLLVRPVVGAHPVCAQVGRHNVTFLPGSNPATTGAAFGVVTVGADYRWTFVGQSPHGKGLTSSQWGYPMDDGQESTPLEVAADFYATDNASTCLYGGLFVSAKARNPGEPGLQYGIQMVHLPQKGRLMPEGGMEAHYTFISSRYDLARVRGMFPNGAGRLQPSAPDTAPIPGVSFELNRQLRALFGTGGANPIKARLDLYAPTGLFTGRFTLTDPDPLNPARNVTRHVNYRGILLPDHQLGAGHFLLPTLADPNAEPPTTPATSRIVSGQILITPDSVN